MNQPDLITTHGELGSAMFRKRPLGAAGIEVVCQLVDGSLVRAAQLSAFSSYRRRYDVSVTDRFHTEHVTLPALDDAFEFTGTMDIGWRVSDAVTVVERGVYDGLGLVRSTLLGHMRQISRKYPVEACAAADAEINAALGIAPMTLPEGIAVHRFSVRLSLDDATRRLLQERRNVYLEGDIERLRIDATRRALNGDNALLMLHLTRHRDDTSSVIDLINRDHTASAQQRTELIKDLLNRGVIQDTDLDELTRALIQQSTTATLGGQLPTIASGVAAVQLPAAPVVNGQVAAPAATAATPANPAVPQPTPAPAAAAVPAAGPTSGDGGGVTGWTPVGKNKP